MQELLLREFASQGVLKSSEKISPECIHRALEELRGGGHYPPQTQVFQVVPNDHFKVQFPAALALQEAACRFACDLVGVSRLDCLQNQLWVNLAGEPASPRHVDGQDLIKVVAKGDIRSYPNFAVIVGVPLIALPQPGLGNFAYIPGGHHRVAKYMLDHWDEYLEMPDSDGMFKDVRNEISKPGWDEVPVCTELGEMLAVHALMPHARTANNGGIRPVWYFRFGNYTERGREALTSAFPPLTWPSIASLQ